MVNKKRILLHILIITGLFLSATSCRQRRLDKDVSDIVAACIRAAIGTGEDSAKAAALSNHGFFLPKDLPHLPNIPEDSASVYFLQRRYDSAKTLLNTSSVYITLNDTLANTRQITESIEEAKKELSQRHVSTDIYDWSGTNIQTADTGYISAHIQISVRTRRAFNPADIRFVADFGFSHIAFNQNKDKAAVFVVFYCGSHCGRGDLMLLERKNGEWLLADREHLWDI